MFTHLRRRLRLHLLVALVVSTCLYFSFVYPSLHVPIRIYKAWHGSHRRLVVFGDSFSDTGIYQADPPGDDLALVRDPDEGKRWTEVLCDEILCDSLENYARSWPAPDGHIRHGAVIHNDLYKDAAIQSNITTISSEQMLPDLGIQVKQWIKHEENRSYQELDVEEELVFTVFFGTWDVWQYAMLNREEAQSAILTSLNHLFAQLDIVVEHASVQPRFVLPGLWDLSFAPRFRDGLTLKEKTALASEEGHKMVYLIKFWNMELIKRASAWKNAHLFVPNLDAWIVDKIRWQQLFTLGITDSIGVGVGLPEFEDVSHPCLTGSHWESDETNDAFVEETDIVHPCDRPDQYLFW